MHPELVAARHAILGVLGRGAVDLVDLLAVGCREAARVLRAPDPDEPLTEHDHIRAWDHQLVNALIGPDRQAIHLTELRDLMRRDPACAYWPDERYRAWLDAALIPVRQVRVGKIGGRLGVHRTALDPRLLALPYATIRHVVDNPSPADLTCVDADVGGAVEVAVDRSYLADPGEEPAFA